MTKRLGLAPIRCKGDHRSLSQIYTDRQRAFETILGIPAKGQTIPRKIKAKR